MGVVTVVAALTLYALLFIYARRKDKLSKIKASATGVYSSYQDSQNVHVAMNMWYVGYFEGAADRLGGQYAGQFVDVYTGRLHRHSSRRRHHGKHLHQDYRYMYCRQTLITSLCSRLLRHFGVISVN